MFGSILIHALKMGSGASTAKDALEPLLLSQELVEGSNTLGSDNTFRISFTNYIKSGAWLNSLSHLVPDFQIILGTSTQKDGDYIRCLHEYNIEHDALVALTAANNENKSPPPSPSVPGGTERILTQRIVKTPSFGIDDYLCSSSSFSQEELLVMLFAILYPIYITSREYKRYLEHGIESNALLPNDDSGSMASGSQPGSNLVQTSQSRRAQELLLGCAAYHDESYLQEYLQDSNWLGRVCTIFHDHPLALCITDTRKTGLPILFANKAFCNLFGYAESAIIGSNLSILCGLCTEASQLKRLHESIHSTEPVKFSITLQSKSKKPLFDLMAQKAVGSYSISAHFVKLKSTQLDALNMVDDTLMFLSYLVKAPPLPTKPSWLPAPIAILARSATNALQHASPSSARSPASHRSKSTAGGGHAKNGKGTPTSVRSFGSRVSAGAFAMGSDSADSSKKSHRHFALSGMRRHSRGGGDNGGSTPKSYRSSGGNNKGAGIASAGSELEVSAGRHAPVDAEAVVEFSIGESTHEEDRTDCVPKK